METHAPCLNISKFKKIKLSPHMFHPPNRDITFWKTKFELRILRVRSVPQCGVIAGHPVV